MYCGDELVRFSRSNCMRLPASLAGTKDTDFVGVRQLAAMQLDYWLHCTREVRSGS
jgi:hypothetical protein